MALEIFRLMGSVFVDTDKATKSLHNVDKKAEGFGKTLLGGIGKAAKWAAGVAVAAGTAGLAFSKVAIDSYAEYEQLVGGVETLFGKSADQVLKYAKGAYKTAGMTANQYMETTTSFAAALLSSLNGDTAEAARISDMAITDLSDNMNKMGSDMSSLLNAYQGFAKQNYTMLDNLKLGYGGTKKEMQRLLKDADAINKKQGKLTKYSINNLNDVYEAIHVVQTEMGITGTTAKEATSTISGQIGMLKARFENFKTTLGESLAPVVKNILSKLIDNLPTIESLVSGLATTAVKVVDFAMPYITAALDFVGKWFSKVPELTKKAQEKFGELGSQLSAKFQPVLKTVRTWLEKLQTAIKEVPAKLQKLKDKAIEVGGYIASKFQPTLNNLKKMFEAVKDKLQPFIDKLSDYIKSGEAAKDATELVKKAGELLKDGFDALAEAAEWVTEKVIEISDWCVENYKTIESIAIVIASFAAAWGLVNVALGIWNGLAAIGAAVTGALAGAGTVLAGVWAFLTSPITLVIAAIGAVIAIGVLLWRNWDTIKAKAQELWKNLVDKFNKLKSDISKKIEELKKAAVDKFNEMKSKIVDAAQTAKSKVTSFFSSIKTNVTNYCKAAYDKVKSYFGSIKSEISTKVSEAYNAAKEKFSNIYTTIEAKAKDAKDKVKSYFSTIKTDITSAVSGAYTKVTEKFNAIYTKITGKIGDAKDKVKEIVDKIKDLFDIELKLDLKLPHIKVDGGEAPWGIGGEGRKPSFSVEWYAKAMNNAMILSDPTIFGYGGGSFLGGGEAGNEVIAGEAHLLDMIGKVVATKTAEQNGQIVALLAALVDATEGGNREIIRALLAGHKIVLNEREVGRTVRAYAG